MQASTSSDGTGASGTGTVRPAGATVRQEPPPPPWFQFVPDDGWLTLALTMMVVFVTIWSIQSVTPPWAPGLSILMTVTAVGLLLAYVSIQQGRLPGVLVHTGALALGIIFAFLQTDDVALGGNRQALLNHVVTWLRHALLANGASNDNAIFLLFLAILTMLLAYITVWLVIRTRRPWLAVLANGVVLLINLNWSSADHAIFLALFLLVSLLLLVRFNLAENMRIWRAKGLRFSPDLSWDFMQAGAIFTVLVLLVAYNLPVGTASPAIVNALSSPHSPLTALQVRLEELFGGLTGKSGPGGASTGFFGGSLKLVGTVNLPETVVLTYTVPNANFDYSQYLVTETFDTYDGTSTWSQSTTQQATFRGNQIEPAPSTATQLDQYNITLDQLPTSGQLYLFAPGVVPASFSVSNDAELSIASNIPTSWLADPPLTNSDASYTADGYVPTATIAQLEQVPFPSQLNPGERDQIFSQALLNEYLPADDSYIAPTVKSDARLFSKGATNMYDAATLIENTLHTFKYSTQNPDPPANQDAVSWFLNRQQGFCTFFASAMALMGRSLGMPTRIVSGFTNGTYDPKHNDFVVKGTGAHTWTQIYFGKYGWVNFEPTSSFSAFARGTNSTGGSSPTPTSTGTAPTGTATPRSGGHLKAPSPNLDVGPGGTSNSPIFDAGLGLAGLIALFLLAIAIFLLYWRLLFRRLSPAAAALARVSRLGSWAGAPPTRAQTPDEYTDRLARLMPAERSTLRELGEVYARERYGGDTTRATAHALSSLYARVRLALTPLILRRTRTIPLVALRRLVRRRRVRPVVLDDGDMLTRGDL